MRPILLGIGGGHSGAGKTTVACGILHELPEILPIAVEMLSNFKGILVEGNSAIDILRPDIVIFVSGPDGEIKSGAERILLMADIVVFDGEPPVGMPQRARNFRRDEVGKISEFISVISKKL